MIELNIKMKIQNEKWKKLEKLPRSIWKPKNTNRNKKYIHK